MKIKCTFLKTQRIKSKSGNSFVLASFLYNGDIIKFIVSDEIYDILSDIGSEEKVYLYLDLYVYRDTLSLSIISVELAS